MGFGTSVAALLETYSNCLCLLKAFKRRGGGGGEYWADDDRQSQLRRSLRSDRAQVRRAYDAGLSESGGRFGMGDARAKSTLSRVLKKLTAAIVNILHTSTKHQRPLLDYDSLTLLSNVSRTQTIHAFDQLSQRLGSSSSHSSLASSSSSSSSKHRRRSSSSSSKASSTSSRRVKVAGPSRQSSGHSQDSRRRSSGSKHSRRSSTDMTSTKVNSRTAGGSSSTAVEHRVSLASVSTDSTKLGEIPNRKRRPQRYSYDSNLDEYNVPAVYPLKRYEPPVKEKKFLGVFRRRS